MSTETDGHPSRRISIVATKIDETGPKIPKIRTASSVNQIIKKRKSLLMTPSSFVQTTVSKSQTPILDPRRTPETKKLVVFDNEENNKISYESLLSTGETLSTNCSESPDHTSKDHEEEDEIEEVSLYNDEAGDEHNILHENEETNDEKEKVVFQGSTEKEIDDQAFHDNKEEMDVSPVNETYLSHEKFGLQMESKLNEEPRSVEDKAVTYTSEHEIEKSSNMTTEITKNELIPEDDQNYLADIFGEDVLPSFSEYEIKTGESNPSIKQEEELEKEEAKEEAIEPIDRGKYYNLYQQLNHELLEESILNGLLQKKMSRYYKKRKMDYVLQDSSKKAATSERKYNKLLCELYNLREASKNEITDAKEEISTLLEIKNRELIESDTNFTSLQKRLRAIAAGLKFTKNGKEISEQLVEYFLKRQKYCTDQLISMRQLLIRLKNGVQEREEKIRQVEYFFSNDPKLTLNRYMELTLTNKLHQDKLEEKEEEMRYHRSKVKVAYQTLAHIREKIAFVQKKKIALKNQIEFKNYIINLKRASLGEYQKKRDVLRHNHQNLLGKSGLLLYPSLQRDFETTLQKYKALVEELEKLKTECKEKQVEILCIQKRIERKKSLLLLASNQSQSLFPQVIPPNPAPAIRTPNIPIIGDNSANTINVVTFSKLVAKSLPPAVVVPHNSQTALSVHPRPYKFNSK